MNTDKWGTLEEKYRLLCMKVLLSRYCYYVLAQPIMVDSEYDRLEDGLKAFEAKMPQLRHPRSPTQIPGSDKPGDYPQSIRFYAENFLEDGRQHTRLACMGRPEVAFVE